MSGLLPPTANTSGQCDRNQASKGDPSVVMDDETRRRYDLFTAELRAAYIPVRLGDDPTYITTFEGLGSGSFGTVTLSYRPSGEGLWLKTAVKRICLRTQRSFSGVLEMVRSAGREVVLCRLAGDSPYVVPVFGPWFDCRAGVIALPMDAGECSLEQYAVRSGFRYPPQVLLSVCMQCTRAVAHVHRCGVVHRDVKPENFVVNTVVTDASPGGGSGSGDTEPLCVRIVDFGLAATVGEMMQDQQDCAGTPHYMAPEAFLNRHEINMPTACDVWSLGVTFFRLVTGAFPLLETGGVFKKPPFHNLREGRMQMPMSRTPSEFFGAESIAVMKLAASMLVVDITRRPTAEWVLQRLYRLQAGLRYGNLPLALGEGRLPKRNPPAFSAAEGVERAGDASVHIPLLQFSPLIAVSQCLL